MFISQLQSRFTLQVLAIVPQAVGFSLQSGVGFDLYINVQHL